MNKHKQLNKVALQVLLLLRDIATPLLCTVTTKLGTVFISVKSSSSVISSGC